MKFSLKVYDKTGLNFLGSFSENQIISSIKWSAIINGGLGECVLDLNLKYFDLIDNNLVKNSNIVKIYAIDSYTPLGKLMYTGVISQHVAYSDGGKEGVRIALLGLYSLLNRNYYNALASVGGINRVVNYEDEDPADMIKDTVDNWQTVTGSQLINYDENLIDDIGALNTISIDNSRHSEQFKKIHELMPANWYWLINASGQVVVKNTDSEPIHKFTLGKDLVSFNVEVTTEEMKNSILLKHESGLVDTKNQDSIDEYGLFEYYEELTGIANGAQAQPILEKLIDEGKNPKISILLKVNTQYNINSIRVGDTCKLLNVKKNSVLNFDNLQIVKLNYTENEVILELDAVRRDYAQALAQRIKLN